MQRSTKGFISFEIRINWMKEKLLKISSLSNQHKCGQCEWSETNGNKKFT